jgi:hypothetical protein
LLDWFGWLGLLGLLDWFGWLGLLGLFDWFGWLGLLGLLDLPDLSGLFDRPGLHSLAGLWVAAQCRLAHRTRSRRRTHRRGICPARPAGFGAGGRDLEIFRPTARLPLADVAQPLGVTTL